MQKTYGYYVVSEKDPQSNDAPSEDYFSTFAECLQFLENTKSVRYRVWKEHHDLLVLDSDDSPYLQKYLWHPEEEWNNQKIGHHKKQDYPSVYFDIDGTLGYWYPDCRGLPIEEIINPVNHYFRDIEPHDMIVALAKQLQENGQDVCVISAAYKDTIRDKWEWIDKYLPFIPKENICFSPIGADKSLFVKGNAEISVLIDDYHKNLKEWKGMVIKAINNVNSNQSYYPEIDIIRPFETQGKINVQESIKTGAILRASNLVESRIEWAELVAKSRVAREMQARDKGLVYCEDREKINKKEEGFKDRKNTELEKE